MLLLPWLLRFGSNLNALTWHLWMKSLQCVQFSWMLWQWFSFIGFFTFLMFLSVFNVDKQPYKKKNVLHWCLSCSKPWNSLSGFDLVSKSLLKHFVCFWSHLNEHEIKFCAHTLFFQTIYVYSQWNCQHALFILNWGTYVTNFQCTETRQALQQISVLCIPFCKSLRWNGSCTVIRIHELYDNTSYVTSLLLPHLCKL